MTGMPKAKVLPEPLIENQTITIENDLDLLDCINIENKNQTWLLRFFYTAGVIKVLQFNIKFTIIYVYYTVGNLS